MSNAIPLVRIQQASNVPWSDRLTNKLDKSQSLSVSLPRILNFQLAKCFADDRPKLRISTLHKARWPVSRICGQLLLKPNCGHEVQTGEGLKCIKGRQR
jgi:hypothetical protein